ncbi:Hypp5632 [Branchiostoma lanceolatum]|uniref:Hypp5632 protein n=1 Tax=Branchiostoma lanceolatum TaxID=7740 RepID=A0A8J9VEM4_BRALA|nr:Hypp5632 [Branchiostoma lanceolatum]
MAYPGYQGQQPDLGLDQLVTFPTRGENTLDLFLTNHPSFVLRIESLPGVSDHDIVYMEFDINPARQRQTRRQVPQYSKADWPALHSAAAELSDSILSAHSEDGNTEQIWQAFKGGLLTMSQLHIPQKTLGRKNNKPWVDPPTLRLIRRRNRLYKRWKKTGNTDTRDKMRDLKHQVQRRLRRAYWLYTEGMFTNNSSEDNTHGVNSHEGRAANTKKLWSYIKSQRTEAANVAPLKVNGKLLTDAKDRAEALNQQFQSAFSQKVTFSDEEFWDRTSLIKPPLDAPTCSSVSISVAGVQNLLQKLNPKKAPGPDGISPKLLKELAVELSPALSLLTIPLVQTSALSSLQSPCIQNRVQKTVFLPQDDRGLEQPSSLGRPQSNS